MKAQDLAPRQVQPRRPVPALCLCCRAALLVLSGLFHAGVYLVDRGRGRARCRGGSRSCSASRSASPWRPWPGSWVLAGRPAGWCSAACPGLGRRGGPHLDADMAGRRVALQRGDHLRRDGLLGHGLAGVADRRAGGLITVWSFLRIDAPASLAAIRAGLVLMLVSQAVGVQMIVEGGNTFGPAGAEAAPCRDACTRCRSCPRWRSCCRCRSPPNDEGEGRGTRRDRVRRPDRLDDGADLQRAAPARRRRRHDGARAGRACPAGDRRLDALRGLGPRLRPPAGPPALASPVDQDRVDQKG